MVYDSEPKQITKYLSILVLSKKKYVKNQYL